MNDPAWKDFLSLGLFALAIIGAVASYFKSVSEIQSRLQTAINEMSEKFRRETYERYTTKEESRFIHATLLEMKSDIKDIKNKVEEVGG